MVFSGPIGDAPGETWVNVDAALRAGTRGLPGRSSLPQLLAEQRGARNMQDLPTLTEEQILAWADAHHQRTGQWPRRESGPVVGVPGETWVNVAQAIRKGLRGLPGGSSLAQLLAKERAVRNKKGLAPLTVGEILAWADAYYQRTGGRPRKESGSIPDAAGETWASVDAALNQGQRSLPRGSSLAQLLAKERAVRNRSALPPLTEDKRLAWADTHFQRTGEWPNRGCGAIPQAPGETWSAVDAALKAGTRGLSGGSSLVQLLCHQRGLRHSSALPPLTESQILAWATSHLERTGLWPKIGTGRIVNAPGETWANVNAALSQGGRSLPGGSSLAQLLAKERGTRNQAAAAAHQDPDSRLGGFSL